MTITRPAVRAPRRLITRAMGLAALACALPAFAQTAAYPNKPIRMIVAVAAGGATDSIARRLADRLSKSLGQTVFVENMPAASGVVAAHTVARAAPDGYTLLIGTNTTHAANASLLKSMPYDPLRDFAPISRLGIAALVLCVNNDVPAKNLQEFIAYAKANPGKLSFGAGTGSARLSSEMLKSKAGIDILAVPYKGNAPALTDLRGGQIQMLFGDIALMLPQIRANAVKALGVSSVRRSATLPDIPTLQELGVPGFELVGFIAAFAPAQTPEPIVRKLNEEMTKVLRDKEFVDSLTAAGMDAPTCRRAAPLRADRIRRWSPGCSEFRTITEFGTMLT